MNETPLSPSQDRLSLLVLGGGRVGASLTRKLLLSGHEVTLRDSEELPTSLRHDLTERGARLLAPRQSLGKSKDCLSGVLLCTPDHATARTARQIIQEGLPPGAPLLITSGSLPLDSIPHGTHPLGRLHPASGFPSANLPVETLSGLCVVAQGDPEAVELARTIARSSGMHLIEVAHIDTLLYHAGCVTASNLTALIGIMAERLLEEAGIPFDQVPRLVGCLMQATLQHGHRDGFRKTVTGPASRGDFRTVLEELRAFPEELHEEGRWFALGNRLIASTLGNREFVDAVDRELSGEVEQTEEP